MQTPTKNLISLAVLLLAAGHCAARGGPAAPAAQPKPAQTAAASVNATPTSAASTPAAIASDEVDKDINPFTGQSQSEAQLRRTLEREKLITAIASEKTKQTQSNSELQMAKLRNVAEKSRLASEVKVIAPVPIAPLPASQAQSKARSLNAPASAPTAAPIMPWQDVATTTSSPTFAAPALSAAPRAEIRFADEVVELKAGPARNPSVVASVDAQRTPEQTQPRAITPIAVAPVALPPVQGMNSAPIVPPPQLPAR